MVYMITRKGRAVLRSATMWGLSRHLRDLLSLCDPKCGIEQARQFLPPESLQIALYSLQQLELIEGPPAESPPGLEWSFGSQSQRLMARRGENSQLA